MYKIIAKYFSIIALFIILLPSARAQEQAVFGPENFDISAWRLHLSRQTFDVADPGDGYIKIEKNTPDSDINGGFLFFNWQLIPLRQFLTGDDLDFYKDIQLKAHNRLTVFF